MNIELFFVPGTVENDAFAGNISVCGKITNVTGEFSDSPIRIMLIPQFEDEISIPSGLSFILVCCLCVYMC